MHILLVIVIKRNKIAFPPQCFKITVLVFLQTFCEILQVFAFSWNFFFISRNFAIFLLTNQKSMHFVRPISTNSGATACPRRCAATLRCLSAMTFHRSSAIRSRYARDVQYVFDSCTAESNDKYYYSLYILHELMYVMVC